MGILNSLDYSNTLTLSPASQMLYSNVHNASILSSAQANSCTPSGWPGTCALVLLYPKLRVIPGGESLLVSNKGTIVVQISD